MTDRQTEDRGGIGHSSKLIIYRSDTFTANCADLGAMEQPAEAREEGWAIRRRHNFCIKELLDDQQLVRLPLVGVVWHHFEVQRLERVVRVD